MNCEELDPTWSLYLDDELSADERAVCDQHLEVCPVCRAELAGTRAMLRGLKAIPRPVAPMNLSSAITDALFIESAAVSRQRRVSPADQIKQWLQPRMMPYSVGGMASMIIFLVMFAALRSSLTGFHKWDQANKNVAMTYQVTSGYDLNQPITPEHFAAYRSDFSPESPSLNPNGALAALSMTPSRTDFDDDMVVVADVFSNGIASLAGVVQAPRDPRMLEDFQQALRKDAAFVPASYDRRPQTIRVVLVVQKVAVTDKE